MTRGYSLDRTAAFTLLLFLAICLQLNALLWIATGQGTYALDAEMSSLARFYSVPRQLLLVGLILYVMVRGGLAQQVRLHLPSLAVLGFWAVSTAWSTYSDDSRRAITLFLMQFVIGAALLVGLSREAFFERLRQLSLLFLVVNLGFWALAPDLATDPDISTAAFRGILVSKNVFGHALGYFVAFHATALLAGPRRTRRRDWMVLAGLLVLLLASQSASSILACFLVATAYAVLRRVMLMGSSAGSRLAIALVTLAPVAVLACNARPLLEFLAPLLGRDATLTGRDTLWAFAQTFLEQRPLLGYGFGGFWPQFATSEGILRQYGLWDVGQIHNGFLEAQLIGGLVGLTVTAAYLAFLIWKVLRRLGQDPRDPVGGLAFAMVGLTLVLNATESDFPGLGRMAFTALVLAGAALSLFPARSTARTSIRGSFVLSSRDGRR